MPSADSARLFLGNDAWNVPVHLPEATIVERGVGRDPFGARDVLDRPGEDLLAGDDGVAFGHHLVNHLLRHRGVAAGDVGAAVLDAGEGAIWTWLPIAGRDLLQFGRQEFFPGPGRRT